MPFSFQAVRRSVLATIAVLLAGYAALSFAADPVERSDTRNVRLIKPYSELKDLTPEQTDKLKAIHKKYLDQIKTLEAAQEEESMAVLSDAQKKELSDVKVQDKLAKKSVKTPKAPPTSDGSSKDPTAPEPKAGK